MKTKSLLILLSFFLLLSACGPASLRFYNPEVSGPNVVEVGDLAAFNYRIHYEVVENDSYYDPYYYGYDSSYYDPYYGDCNYYSVDPNSLEVSSQISLTEKPATSTSGVLPFTLSSGLVTQWILMPDALGTYKLNVSTEGSINVCGYRESGNYNQEVSVQVVPTTSPRFFIERTYSSIAALPAKIGSNLFLTVPAGTDALRLVSIVLEKGQAPQTVNIQLESSSTGEGIYSLTTENGQRYRLPVHYAQDFPLSVALTDTDGDGVDEFYIQYGRPLASLSGRSVSGFLPIYAKLGLAP